MTDVPRVFIGLPVYNGEKYLEESLDALLGQTYTDWELVIADNASTDGTADICRAYEMQDSRIRYHRQQRNIGAAPNHHYLFTQSRSDYFKWASADDLYARDMLERCVGALDEHPEAVLANCWTAAIDSTGKLTQALDYPLATDSPSVAVRFRAMLLGSGDDDYGLIRADDQYAVIRSDVLRKIPPQGSYYSSDRTQMAELALHGPFHHIPEWLYFRRDHSDRPKHATPTIRGWCSNLDPRRANKLRHPTARLVAEFVWGYVSAIQRAPISGAERMQCYRIMAEWFGSRATPAVRRITRGGMLTGQPVEIPPPPEWLSVEALVAGREHKAL